MQKQLPRKMFCKSWAIVQLFYDTNQMCCIRGREWGKKGWLTLAGSLKHHNYPPLFLSASIHKSVIYNADTSQIHKAKVPKFGQGLEVGITVCGLRIITSQKEDLRVTSTQISMKWNRWLNGQQPKTTRSGFFGCTTSDGEKWWTWCMD